LQVVRRFLPKTEEPEEKHESFLDKIIVYDKKGSDRSVLSYLKLIKKLRTEKYDMAIIPHRSFRSALVARLAGIKERLGFDNSQGRMFLSRVFPFQWSTHDLERNYVLLKPLGIELPGPAAAAVSRSAR